MFCKIHTLCISYNRIRCDLIIAYFFNAFKWMLDRETSAKMREQKQNDDSMKKKRRSREKRAKRQYTQNRSIHSRRDAIMTWWFFFCLCTFYFRFVITTMYKQFYKWMKLISHWFPTVMWWISNEFILYGVYWKLSLEWKKYNEWEKKNRFRY